MLFGEVRYVADKLQMMQKELSSIGLSEEKKDNFAYVNHQERRGQGI
jgi:hypothetical protein